MGKLPQPRPYLAAARQNWDIGPLSRGPSSIDRILSFWIWPIQLGSTLDFEEIIGFLHNRRLQDPSNMGTAYFSLLLEGSWTPLEGTPPECSSTIYQFSMCPSTFSKEANYGSLSAGYQRGLNGSTWPTNLVIFWLMKGSLSQKGPVKLYNIGGKDWPTWIFYMRVTFWEGESEEIPRATEWPWFIQRGPKELKGS